MGTDAGTIVIAVIIGLVGLWLIFSAMHLILTIIGWVLVIGAAITLINWLFGRRRL